MVINSHDPKEVPSRDNGGRPGSSGWPSVQVAVPGIQRADRSSPLKVMIVGDSMTAGSQGDYTWRYRIWQWFTDYAPHTSVKFVGPYIGTQQADVPKGPDPPPIPGEPGPPDTGPRTSGPYADDVAKDFDSHHFSVWGYAAAQAKGAIKEQVEEYQPDMLLVFLGFNDMGWFISNADGTLESMDEIVKNARAAKSKISFALGSVPERTFMEGRQDLVDNTLKFNRMLKEKCPEWSRPDSHVALTQIAEHYVCEVGAYDGLHPNALGDFQIAKAFSLTLHDDFGMGSGPLQIPSHIPERKLPVPQSIVAEGSPMGVKVTWDAIPGVMYYDVRNRIKPGPDWNEGRSNGARYDTTYASPGEVWEYQVRSGYGLKTGDWSDVVTGIAQRETAPPPRHVKIRATADGFQASWEPPEGHWDVERYEIMWYDVDSHGFPGIQGARHSPANVTGLETGHRYLTWMATWTKKGGGVREGARTVRCGEITAAQAETLAAPTDLKIIADSPNGAKLSWTASEDAAAYQIYVRKVSEPGSEPRPDGGCITETERGFGFLFPSPSDFEYSVQAVNGDLESVRSAGVVSGEYSEP